MGNSLRLIFWGASLLLACEAPHVARPSVQRPTSLVLIHTADLHSHLFPERLLVGNVDAARGLGAAGEVSEVGGFARVASIVKDIRAGAPHTLFLDSGDLIEGTAAFTEFGGEAELRAFSALELAAAALGNHDLDPGASAFAETHARFASFPVLASNFAENGSELSASLAASRVLDAQGLRVGVIGVANPNSPGGLSQVDNPYEVALLPTTFAVQAEIERLRPEVDLIVALSHLGLNGDEALIRGTSGLDVVLGGHQHLALGDALERLDCGPAVKAERGCAERSVTLVHSGALGRYVGEVDLSLVPASDGISEPGLEVEAAKHFLLPVSAEVSEDPALSALLEPYRAGLLAAGFDEELAFALGPIERYGTGGGDSALGDLITDAVRSRTMADVVILNSTGIRANLPPGPVSRAALVAALPFGDTLTELTLSGSELRSLFNQQARVASGRQCQTPIQISGFTLEMDCSGLASSATAVSAGSGRVLDASVQYTLVTSTYLATGGSGFEQLSEVTTRRLLDADPLDALIDAIQALPSCPESKLPCLAPAALRDGRIVMRGNQ